jgi:hypothetical protein
MHNHIMDIIGTLELVALVVGGLLAWKYLP